MSLSDFEIFKNMKYNKPLTKEEIDFLKIEIDDMLEEQIKIFSKIRNQFELTNAHLDEIDHDINILYRMQMLIKGVKNNEP